MQNMLYADFQQAAWDIQKLCSLGVQEEIIAEAHPSPGQVADLLKGLLYLKEMYPSSWGKSNSEVQDVFGLQ